MKRYVLKDKDRNDVTFHIDKDDILKTEFFDLDFGSVDFYLDRNVDAADNNSRTLSIPNEIELHINEGYNRGTVGTFEGQFFMALPEDQTRDTVPTDRSPRMFSPDWIALSNNNIGKCIGIINGNTNDNMTDPEYGSLIRLFKSPNIVRDFYKYFNDGDYYIITDVKHDDMVLFHMRLNRQTWRDPSDGKTYGFIDAISDEVIPNFSIDSPYGTEGESTIKSNSVYKMNLNTLYGRIVQGINMYLNTLAIPQFFKTGVPKKRNYWGVDRQFPILKGNYESVEKMSYYMNDFDTIDNRPMNTLNPIWLPTEKEIFGKTYNCLVPQLEASFQQYKTLDSAYKRVKTLEDIAVPWLTYSTYKGTFQPIIVDRDGTEVCYEAYNNMGGYRDPVHVPFCITLATERLD